MPTYTRHHYWIKEFHLMCGHTLTRDGMGRNFTLNHIHTRGQAFLKLLEIIFCLVLRPLISMKFFQPTHSPRLGSRGSSFLFVFVEDLPTPGKNIWRFFSFTSPKGFECWINKVKTRASWIIHCYLISRANVCQQNSHCNLFSVSIPGLLTCDRLSANYDWRLWEQSSEWLLRARHKLTRASGTHLTNDITQSRFPPDSRQLTGSFL